MGAFVGPFLALSMAFFSASRSRLLRWARRLRRCFAILAHSGEQYFLWPTERNQALQPARRHLIRRATIVDIPDASMTMGSCPHWARPHLFHRVYRPMAPRLWRAKTSSTSPSSSKKPPRTGTSTSPPGLSSHARALDHPGRPRTGPPLLRGRHPRGPAQATARPAHARLVVGVARTADFHLVPPPETLRLDSPSGAAQRPLCPRIPPNSPWLALQPAIAARRSPNLATPSHCEPA